MSQMQTYARYIILRDEMASDPLGRGYAGMADAAAAADLNTTYRERNRDALSPDTVATAIDETEWNALTDAERTRIQQVLTWDAIDLFNSFVVNEFVTVFGNPSATRTALLAGRTQAISRATELSLPTILAVYVTQARSM